MMMRAIVAAIAALVIVTAAEAQPVWVTGFETANSSIECAGSFNSGSCGSAGTCTSFGTSSPRSGAYDLVITHGSTSTEGSCQIATGLSDTGTFVLTGAVRHQLVGGIVCGPTQSDGMLLEIRNSSGTDVASLRFKCTSGASDYEVSIFSGAGLVGSRVSLPVGTTKSFEIKVTTGAGSGVVGGRIDGVSVGSDAAGLTIANVDAIFASHQVTSGVSTQEMHLDDIVLLKQSTYPGPTYVNLRKPDANGGTNRNQWTKANGGNIQAEWTSPQATTLPAYGAMTTYATSIAADTDGQTANLAAWDSGTPTPTIPASATGVNDIYGCQYIASAARTSGTARNYAIYSYQGSKTSTTTTLGNETLGLFRQHFAAAGADAAAKLASLNGLEVGGEKTTDTSGANMVIEDVWVQCAWSLVPVTSGMMVWTQNE